LLGIHLRHVNHDYPAPVSRWRPSPRRLAQLLVGLWLFGTGEGLIVLAGLGNSPWTVLAQGVSVQTPLSIGAATIIISAIVVASWALLREVPGLGTVLNAVLVGIAIDVTVRVVPSPGGAWRFVALLGGIGLVAVASGLYLTARLGPGPRDGLMTGLVRRTGRSFRAVRLTLELSALLIGALLGGTVGIGTVAFALLIPPAVHAILGAFGHPSAEHL
jgi:uncharacterized membrane protein YczE